MHVSFMALKVLLAQHAGLKCFVSKLKRNYCTLLRQFKRAMKHTSNSSIVNTELEK